MLGASSFLRKLLMAGFGAASSPQQDAQPQRNFPTPESVVFPGTDAPLEAHVQFLLDARHYVRNHPVPKDHIDSINQYSHSKGQTIGNDVTKPAITNCSYEHYGHRLISLGFPLFIREAPLLNEGQLNPAFNAATFWESFERVAKHYVGNLGDGDSKFGYYEPINHRYIEKPVSQEIFDKSQAIIELYTRTDIDDSKAFIAALDKEFLPAPRPLSPGQNRIGGP